ncbi:MAG: serine/threonine protein kinase [Oscillospiraceae bacterium]|nr:serine/threonine protein kinase [Oscillospiraceae bacterium]
MINNPQNTCMSCFTQHAAPVNLCPVCGYDETAQEFPPHLLRPRTILNGKYLLGKVLGQGGFGITYIGWDLNLNIKVAIKEYYPSGFVTREATSMGNATVQPFTGSQGDFFLRGREKFINEAQTLARFFALPGIVSIKDYFQENGTAYISMEYIDGRTLKDYLSQMGGKLPAGQIFDMMKPVMTSLAEIHNAGLIHRDISPDNIMISKEGYMKLLDFGAARDFTDSGNKSMSIMLKPGFAPEEQYRSRGVQGPWTDVYALSATIYKCITGVTPEESVERVHEDQVKPPSSLGFSVDPTQEAALMKGMAVLQKNRFQNVPELYASLHGQQAGVPGTAQMSATSSATPATEGSPPYVQEKAQENRPPVLADAQQAQAATPVFESSPNSIPSPSAVKPKRMTKEKWIITIACGLVAGLLTFAFGMWQSSSNSVDRPDILTGTWVGALEMGDDIYITELMFDDSSNFYLVESLDGFEGFYVYEGTYTISDSRLQMTLLWAASIFDSLPNGYHIFDWDSISTESNISIDANTLQIDNLGFGMAYGIVLTKGTPSGLWSFEHRERLTNMSTPEVQSPRDTTHVATVTLGDFHEFGGFPDNERGWWSDNVGDSRSPYTARDFTDSRYMILEFDRKPYGDIEFAWIGDTNDWVWTTTSFTPQSRILIIDLALINGYNQYIQASSLKIFICCYDDSWDNLTLVDAYFANVR